MEHSGWASIASRIYYFFGAAYYLYKWGTILGIGGIIGGAAIGGLTLYNPAYLIAPSVAISLFSLWTGAKKYRIEQHSINPGLNIVKEESIYEQHNDGSYTYIKNIVVKATQHGVNSFRTKYKWSGLGQVLFSTPVKHHTIQLDELKAIPWDTCEVIFASPLKKGQIEDIKIHIKLVPGERQPAPFLARVIDEPYSNGIDLCVILPSTTDVSTVLKEIYIFQRSLTPVYTEKLPFDRGSRRICWHVPHPRLGCRYNLKWC